MDNKSKDKSLSSIKTQSSVIYSSKFISVRDICYISMFVAIISICAQIQIPMPFGVPLTMQTFTIMLAGIVLGIKKGVIAVVVYVLLGAFGVPVFSSFSGGLGIIFGKTGGFILSFPLLTLISGIGMQKINKFNKINDFERFNYNRVWLAFWLTFGASVNFACGVLMFSFVTSMPLAMSFGYAAAPFIPTEVIKIIILTIVGGKIKKRVTGGVPF